MADLRYLMKRHEGWYFVIAVPREMRGKAPWAPKTTIVRSLKTRDLTLAQSRRWDLAQQYSDAFRRSAGDIALTRVEVEQEARIVYHETLRALEAKPVSAAPERQGDDPELTALSLQIDALNDAASDPDFSLPLGLDGVGSHSVVADDIAAVETRTGSRVTKDSETYRLLGQAIIEAKVAAIEGRIAALRRQPSEEPAAFSARGIDRVTLRPLALSKRPKVRMEGKAFSEIAAEYVAEVQRDPSAMLTEQTRGQHEMAFRLFADFAKDAPLAEIDRSIASGFLAEIAKLDPNWGRSPHTKGRSLADVLDRFGQGDRQLSNRSLNRYASSLAGLFKWARKRGYFDGSNPFSEQARPKARKGSTGWVPYTVEELNTLFGSALFTEVDTKDRVRPARHTVETALRWVPLIALFSGMRLGEICQLRTADLQREGKIWFFNVTEEGESQSVKTPAGIRRVPVHSALVDCGMLKYAAGLPTGQLFPGLKPGGPDGKLSWYVSRRYTAYRRNLRVDRARLSFHSFRKTASTALDNAGVPQADVAALIGHERGFTFDTYSKGLELQRLGRIIEKIKYTGLQLRHLHVDRSHPV